MISRPGIPALFLALTGVGAYAMEVPLSSGLTFPDLVGRTLSGADITVGMRDGIAKVVVMTFTKGAATPAQAWLDACRADETAQRPQTPAPATGSPAAPNSRVACYDVRMGQAIPRLVRGFIEGRMKKGLNPEHLSRVVLIYKDNEAWRDRMVVFNDNENQPFIVMVDRQGRVQSLLQGAFNPQALKAEQAKLALP